MNEYLRKAHYYETDQMGVVHHSNYIRWFEEARLFGLEQLGIRYRQLEENGIIIPVVDVSCRYLQSVRYDDTVSVSVRLTKFNGVRMEFSYEIRFQDSGEPAAAGSSCHCFLKNGKPVSIKRLCPELYELLAASLVSE